jgi:uncharacterized protein involved in exopolysaccharide biosynthesis
MSDDNAEISLADILAVLAKRRKVALSCAAAVTILGLLYAIFATPLYVAKVVVQPAPAQGTEGALSSLAAQFGPAAALAGINFGGNASTKDKYLAILKSRQLAAQFMRQPGVLPAIFPKRWDAQAQAWREPRQTLMRRVRRAISMLLSRLSGDEGWKERGAIPSESEAYERFRKIVTFDEDVKSGIVTVSFKFRNPILAAQWANEFVDLANKEIQKATVDEASRVLEYLSQEVEKTAVTGLRNTMYTVIERHLEQIALASARDEYAFSVIDRATVPEERALARSTIVIVSLLLGLLLGAAVALVMELVGRQQPRGR